MSTIVSNEAEASVEEIPRPISVHVEELKRANPEAVISVTTTLDQGQPNRRMRDITLTAPKLDLERVTHAARHRLILDNLQSRRSGKNTVVTLTYVLVA